MAAKKNMCANPLSQKTILLGVTGSIAAYKAADLASKLTQAGAIVNTIFTSAAAQFITPLTFQSVTGREVYSDADLWGMKAHILHVDLARKADLFVIAPITANTMAKLAHGIADNLLTISSIAFRAEGGKKPFIIVPAMDAGMFSHPATQENLQCLVRRGAIVIGPAWGHLASGLAAQGRMTDVPELFGHIRYWLGRNGALQGKRIVVSAGGTQEALDPVRILTNRSSGKQGYALAQAALDAGADVTLISAPSSLTIPVGAEYIPANSAQEMEKAVLAASRTAHALIMAAAVADFRPKVSAAQKIKKGSGPISIDLERTTDILSSVKEQRQRDGHPEFVVGFAAETENLLENARGKMEAKNLDMIIANDVSEADAGFNVDSNRVTILSRDGKKEPLPLLSKAEVAEEVIGRVIAHLVNHPA